MAAFAIVLATLLVPLGITATWLSHHVDSTPAYVDTVAPLADDPQLRDRLADEVADAAIATLQSKVPVGLPSTLDPMVRASTRTVVDSDGFPAFWRQANADAHRQFLAIVHEKHPDVVSDGWVIIDLGPLLDQVLADLVHQVPLLSQVDLPPSSLPVPVVRESRLQQARGAYLVLDALAFWLPLAWLGLVAIAVLAARGVRGRLRTAGAAGIGVAVGALLVLLLTGPATDAVVSQVGTQHRGLVRLVIDVVVASLDDTARAALAAGLVVGLVLLVASVVLGRPRSATSA
jgi:hypothetical protein